MQSFHIPQGLHIRPSTASDNPFLEQLYRATREDLQAIDGERDFIESIIEMQFQAQSQGYGADYPNAMYFIIEKHQEKIGKVTIDFGHNEAHLLDIAFLPKARDHGFGKAIIQSFQNAAAQSRVPMSLTVFKDNLAAQKLYTSLGFVAEEYREPYYRMCWYPTLEMMT